jgi:uncharacterized small protein (DUF1192 family)
MRIRNLYEALGKEVALIFGRFNPPHKGHRAAWELASKSPIWYVGTNQSTQGPKDPLPYDIKIEAMKTIWPEVEGHIVAETSWLTAASMIYKKHGDVTLLCLTDEDWVTKTIRDYNGKEGPHGFYNFNKIEQKPTPRLSSATALRDAVSKGDRDAFANAAGVDADIEVAGKPFFDLVAEYLLPYQNAPKKVAKKKVAQPVEGVAEGLSKRDQQDVAAIRAAIARLEAQLNHPNADRDAIQQSIAHEKKRLALYGQGVAEDAAGVGIITKQNTTKDVNKGTLRKMMKAFHLIDSMSKELDSLTEAPIEMDPSEPMNPMIVGTKSNPAKLQYRMLRAANQLKDLAQRAQGASAIEWDSITKNFDELAMNIGEIKHALDELRKVRSKGGVRSRGIENF